MVQVLVHALIIVVEPCHRDEGINRHGAALDK